MEKVDEVDPAAAEFRPITPPDPKEADRAALQLALGFKPESNPELDQFAQQVIELTGAWGAGVNHVGVGLQQFFPGMAIRGLDGAPPDENRVMDADHGFCVHVVSRERAMAINNVMDYPRFATNPVIEELGVKAYIGAPLVTPDGRTIGTVWGVDTDVRGEVNEAGDFIPAWTQADVDAMKELAATVVKWILDHKVQPQ